MVSQIILPLLWNWKSKLFDGEKGGIVGSILDLKILTSTNTRAIFEELGQ